MKFHGVSLEVYGIPWNIVEFHGMPWGVHGSSILGMKISLVGGFPLDSLAESGFP